MTFRRGPRRPDDWPTVHDRARSALSDQLDGELDAEETAWLHDHLAGCPDCRRTADEYAAQRFELRALRDRPPLPPRDLWARTAAAIESEARGRSSATGRSTRRLLLAPSAFIATALVVAVATGLLTSSRRPVGDGNAGSSGGVAVASSAASATPGDVALGPTPIPVRKNIEFVAPDSAGKLRVNVKTVSEVCPEGATQPCDTTAPVEERSITIDQDAQAVFGEETGKRLIVVSAPDGSDSGTVSVVALADEGTPTSTPSASPSESVSPTSASASPPPPPPPSASPRSAPPSAPASPTPSPTVSATPTGSIDISPPDGAGATVEIARGVVLVGQTAAYSASGSWFAFTARPIDGSSGPDVYLWRVGTSAAQRVTEDGRSVFGSWVGDQVVGSAAVDTKGGGDAATTGLRPVTFFLDPASGTRTEITQAGSAWRPAIAPGDLGRAVYWNGTLRTVDGPGFAPEAGRLVLGDWDLTAPAAPGSPDATPLTGDQSKARHETTIAAGQMNDWDARWDPTGTHLAVWIADPQDPAIGRLSLYAVSTFDGTIDLKKPLLEARLAAAGFSISDGSLIWAEPARDGGTSAATIQLLAWTDDGMGTVQTQSGPAIVIR